MLTFNRQSLKKDVEHYMLRYVKEASNIEQLFKTKNKPTTTIQLRMEILYNGKIIFLF